MFLKVVVLGVSARKDEIVNVCSNDQRMTVDGNSPHAALKTDKSASLRFKIGTHVSEFRVQDQELC
jgi:hypothetical protein